MGLDLDLVVMTILSFLVVMTMGLGLDLDLVVMTILFFLVDQMAIPCLTIPCLHLHPHLQLVMTIPCLLLHLHPHLHPHLAPTLREG